MVISLFYTNSKFDINSFFNKYKEQYIHQQYLLNNEKIEIALIEQQHDQLTQQVNTLMQVANHNKQQLYLLQRIPNILPTGSWLEAISSQIGELMIKANSYDYHEILQFMRQLSEQKIAIKIQLQTI
ncbi:MAG TPA: PilN domain-containing protein [Arsenophonus sp.]